MEHNNKLPKQEIVLMEPSEAKTYITNVKYCLEKDEAKENEWKIEVDFRYKDISNFHLMFDYEREN